jgi:adenylate cyclase
MGTEGSALRPTALFGANALASEFEDAALTSAVSAPILVRDALQGVLSVLDIGGLLQEDDLLNGLVQEIANLLGQEIDRSLGPALAQQRIASGEYCLAHLFHQGSKWVAVMFADLRGFTSATELLAVRRGHLVDSGGMPVDLPDPAGLVSQFCGRMVEEVCVFGRVDKLIGDAVMAVVGDLLPAVDEERTVLQAVCTSTRMCDVFQDLVDEWQDPGGGWLPQFRRHFNEDVNLRLGIGINFGPAVFGFYGSEDHKEYTAIGDVVNTAQRLEDQASREDDRGVDREPILISQTVYVRAAPYLTGIVPHRLSVPGKARPITGYGVTGFDRERCRAAHGGACDQCPGGQWRWEAREAAGAPSP